MGRGVRSDVRRFVFFRWRLIEVPQDVPLDPMRIWRERYGFLPPLGMGGVAGFHFLVGDGMRAVRIVRPEPLQVPEPVRNRLFSAITAKHHVAEVRLARNGESPNLRAPDRRRLRRRPTFTETLHPEDADFTTGQWVARWALFIFYAVPFAIVMIPSIIFPFLILGEMWPIPQRVQWSRREQFLREQKAILDSQWHGGELTPEPFRSAGSLNR